MRIPNLAVMLVLLAGLRTVGPQCSQAQLPAPCEKCERCVAVPGTMKMKRTEYACKDKVICWPCCSPLALLRVLCGQCAEYHCQSRTVHVLYKKVHFEEVPGVFCKSAEPVAQEAAKQAEKDAKAKSR
jgi:hypothetical protein